VKFIVSSSALLEQLQSINGVVSDNPVVPILEHFLFDYDEKPQKFILDISENLNNKFPLLKPKRGSNQTPKKAKKKKR
jgi:DNA polymerase-3 subunit beta